MRVRTLTNMYPLPNKPYFRVFVKDQVAMAWLPYTGLVPTPAQP
jgi:hypothetical protein